MKCLSDGAIDQSSIKNEDKRQDKQDRKETRNKRQGEQKPQKRLEGEALFRLLLRVLCLFLPADGRRQGPTGQQAFGQ